MHRLYFVLIVVALIGTSLGIVFAQDDAANGGTLRGQITDLTPVQNPIEGIKVKIVAQDGGQEFTTTTDADGEYKHAGLPAGRYLISIFKEGYDDQVGRPVTVVDGGDHFISLKMARKRNVKPFFMVEQQVRPKVVGRTKRMDVVVKQRIKQQIESLSEGVAEEVGKRYNLDEAVVKVLHRSILDSIEEDTGAG